MITRDEYEFVFQPAARQFCGPIFFIRSVKTAIGNVTANGSFGLVDTGHKKLLVTNFHVWDEFQKQRMDESDLQMRIAVEYRGHPEPLLFAPQNSLSEDRDLDIATFDMESLFATYDKGRFYPLHQNPARQLVKGDNLFCIGFPGHLRQVVEGGSLQFGIAGFALSVWSVDGPNFFADLSNVSIPQEQYKGISGCPCFLVRAGRPIQLAGFVRGVWKNYLRFTHARCLNADGTLKK